MKKLSGDFSCIKNLHPVRYVEEVRLFASTSIVYPPRELSFMKLVHKICAFALAATGVSLPIATFAAEGNITASLIGMAIVLEAQGYEAVANVYYDVVPSHSYDVLRFPLDIGYRYSVTAACDDNECQDLDLAIYSPSGTRMDSDTTNGTNASVGLRARENGEHQIQVLMRGCSQAACEYGVQIWRQRK